MTVIYTPMQNNFAASCSVIPALIEVRLLRIEAKRRANRFIISHRYALRHPLVIIVNVPK